MKLKVYGTKWCADCIRIKYFLKRANVEYDYVDIDNDSKAAEFVIGVNPSGFRSVPVLEFEDGTILIEPGISEVQAHLSN